ncbi:AMP-binding protein [Actinomadura meridiana]|uniref:AMP-binding protein n=1 Tax=Actinomadura meridiana TaxID=559626 RepID=A0ABP8CAL2_9ACTN
MSQKPTHKRGLYLGVVPERAAAKNGSTPLVLDHDLDALPDAGRRLTFAQVARHVDDLARRLAAAGVRPGQHLVIHKSANFDVWVLGSAAARAGAVPVMLSHTLDAPTVAGLLERLGRPHLLADDAKLDALADVPLADLADRVITVHGPRPGAVSLSELADSPPVRPVFQGLDEPAMVTHTSGTTGLPKLVVHTPRTMRARLRPQLFLLTLMRKRETVAIHISFVHSRMFAAMSLCMQKSLPVLLVNKGEPDDVADFFAEHRPGLIEALPSSFMTWENLADDPRKPFASVKYFSSTFDAMHPRTIRRLLASSQRRTPQYFQIYGQSEVGPAVGRPYFRGSVRRMDGRCVGFPLPGSAKVRVVSEDGARPSKANPGLIEARWDGIAKTYFGEQERYDANVHDGWWRTGDVGYRTRFGCLHMLDREVDAIAGVGSSLEIEDLVLNRMEELTELVVVPGPNGEPTPVVCTFKDKPLDLDRWSAAVTEYPQLAEPVHIPMADLPRTATLKTRRIELSRMLRDELPERT